MSGNDRNAPSAHEINLMDKIFATLAAHDVLLKAMIRTADTDYRRRIAGEYTAVADSMRAAFTQGGKAPAGFLEQYDRLIALAKEQVFD
ncbi:hypothetical protein [Lysobacter sp. Root690]|uniref:hypothetical protein n=1 Tax=Lysobacter sp. Root690 TaxID=1736588 RepID=UPI0006F7C694|nr:hypothetical protein [Lysobacter sp. Root690]KRB08928.1 hypothetical protein ASD86_06525 [Lysobacter sp. Root690]